ncbi:ankyrin repeat-containing domain protein [Aspergillus pseudonomiae]|nr:ankyrin repeat-containing domain protein [Aspergillus pseudonomiae]
MALIYELPHKILLLIIEQLGTEQDISHNVRESNGSALIYAARYGRLSTARKAIKLGGADPNSIAANQTVLSHAAETGHAEICDFLLSHYNVNVASRHIGDNFTPLLTATIFGHAPVVWVLLAHGTDPNSTKEGERRGGRSALSLACVRGVTAVVDVLLAGAPELKVDGYYTKPVNNEVPFLAAITYRRESIALKLLDRGADPCVPLRGRAPHNTSVVAKFSARTLGTLIDGSQLRVL